MTKTYLNTMLASTAVGTVAAIIPSNSRANSAVNEASAVAMSGSELVHGIVVLILVGLVVATSRMVKNNH